MGVVSRVIASIAKSDFVSDRARRLLLRHLGWTIEPRCLVRSGCFSAANNTTVRTGARIEQFVFLDDHAGIEVRSGAVIAANCSILTRTHPIEESLPRQKRGHDIDLPVIIGEGAWLANGATVLPGVTVAEGCVIGAGSVVTKSTEPHGLYIGSPAKRVRELVVPVD